MLRTVVVSFLLLSTCECSSLKKHSIRIDTTFEENQARNHTVARDKAANERINLSFPGTKWCGPGNTANDYDDLGSDKDVDSCCRDHDHCDNMAAGEEKNGLKNEDYFTRLHCQCDKEFKECLKNVNSRRGNFIGSFYFNIRDRCYKEQYPIVSCDEIHTRIFLRRCIRYVIDSLKPLKWQWFDLPFYSDKNDFEFIEEEHQAGDENTIEIELKEFVKINENTLLGKF